MDSENQTPPKRKRKIWRWLLGGLVLWIALAWLEDKLIDRMDRMIRADRSRFEDYVERLPNPIIFPPRNNFRHFCEQPRVWGLWTYEVCLYKTEYSGVSTSDPCPSPNYSVSYEPPNYILQPDFQKWRRSPFRLRQDKTVCDENDIREEN